jgi:carboxylesterase
MPRDRDGLMGVGDPSPLRVSGNDPPVLALHGFGGTPLEIALAVEVAEGLGLRAYAPLLPGHGTRASDLAKTGYADWLRGASEALDALARPGAPVIVIGLSLGSLLAAELAATRPHDVRAIGMLANATRLAVPFPDWALRAVEALRVPDFSLPKAGADIADPEARATHLTYELQPVHCALEVLHAGERVERMLPRVTAPAFIAHGKGDHVCPVANAERVRKQLGSVDKQVLILPRSWHIVTRDYDREALRVELRRFIQRVATRAPSAQTPVEP